MAKTKTRNPQPPNADNQHLDETIENLTEEVARTANRYRMPIILFFVICIAGLLLFQAWGKLQGAKIQGQNDEISTVFTGTDDEIRAAVPALLESFHSQKIEPILAIRFASWLFEKNAEGDRENALEILVAAQVRHPASLLLPTHIENYRQAIESSAGFILPEPEPIPAPDPIVIEPADGQSTGTTDSEAPVEGDAASDIKGPDLQSSGGATEGAASTEGDSAIEASTEGDATGETSTEDASSADESTTEDSSASEAGGEEASSTEETGGDDSQTTEGGSGR